MPPRCPLCTASDVVPIVYGLPDEALAKRAERGEVSLGGCFVHGDNPTWHCKKCGYEFGRERDA
jgi:transposase-like protein